MCETLASEQSGVWARVKYSDGGVSDVPISFFKDRGDVEPELLAGQSRSEYSVFWSPREEDTPASVLKSGNRVIDVARMTKVLKANASKTQSPYPGWYKAELMLYSTGKPHLFSCQAYISRIYCVCNI